MDREIIERDKVLGEALRAEAEEAKKAGVVGYMARAFVHATIPHKATPGSEFTRENGFYSLTILAPSKIGLPYGSIPRLLLSWMTTEAFYTRSPVLELGPTLSAFLAELGLARQGGKRGDITRLRNQIVRLFSSTVSCQYRNEVTEQGSGFRIAKEYNLWWTPKSPDQVPLWQSTVTLSTDFFKEITDRPVPVDMNALKALKRSPLELDRYCWLTYRMSYLKKDAMIPWPLLQLQFGADYAQDEQGLRNFKKKLLLRLKRVLEVYETAKVDPLEKGLLLKPSPPHVAKKPVPLLPGSRRRPASSGVIEKMANDLFHEEEPDDRPILLKTETYNKAKEAFSPLRLDVYDLEQQWREWIAQKGERPKNPDQAFIGFCRQKAKKNT